jgi:hypothetical protein
MLLTKGNLSRPAATTDPVTAVAGGSTLTRLPSVCSEHVGIDALAQEREAATAPGIGIRLRMAACPHNERVPAQNEERLGQLLTLVIGGIKYD